MKKAVAYMRYSSHNQNETSIEYQLAAIERYCDARGIQLVEKYQDMAFSAKTDRRPDFQKMMREAKNRPEWNMILVYDLSRFARNVQDAIKYGGWLEDRGIDLVSVTQEFGESNEGFLLEGMTHLMNDYYSRNVGKVTHAGMMVKANKAGHCGGIAPLGYDLDDLGYLVINEEEAETVRKIFDMYEKDYSYSRMARILNEEGKKTKVGANFTKYSFNELLHQKKYIGLYVWNRNRKKDSGGFRNAHAEKPIEQQVRIENGCPRIISDEQFWRVQEKLASRAQGRAESKRRNHYMLGGLKVLKCACCGSYMVGTSRTSHGKAYMTYSCPKHKGGECPTKEIRTDALDDMVTALLARDLYQRNDLQRISGVMKNDGIKRLMDKRRGVQKKIDRIMKAIESSDAETPIQHLAELEQERAALDRAIADNKYELEGITKENRKRVCKVFKKCLAEMDVLEVRDFLQKTLGEILVTNDDVMIEMRIA